MQIYDLVLYDESPKMIIAIHPAGVCRLWPDYGTLPRLIPYGDLKPVPDDRVSAIKRLFTEELTDRREEVASQLREIDRQLAALN